MISWFRTSVGQLEIQEIRHALLAERVSMGRITEEFENRISKKLEVPYCVITPSGSVALLLSLMACGIGPGDEVIIPNRGWIAAAHAVLFLGARVVLADVCRGIPIIDVQEIKKKITSRTKAIIPLYLNGRGIDFKELLRCVRGKRIFIIEDACQAVFSKNNGSYLGTQGDIGCFSLGMAKLMATGQGGFAVTRKEKLYRQLRLLRNHGVKDNFTDAWHQLGFNFKFTDLQAAMGLAQLQRVPDRIKRLKAIYKKYEIAFSKMQNVRMIPVNIKNGEIPLYIEVIVNKRDALMNYLGQQGIQSRPATPDLNPTPYLKNHGKFPNSHMFSQQGMYLPCGPEQPMKNIDRVIQVLKKFDRQV